MRTHGRKLFEGIKDFLFFAVLGLIDPLGLLVQNQPSSPVRREAPIMYRASFLLVFL